jgi:hypothetical protein
MQLGSSSEGHSYQGFHLLKQLDHAFGQQEDNEI